MIDDNGRDISAYNVLGELCVRGPTIINGYFENEEANKISWDTDGWFKTGDVAYCDEKSKLWYIVDRKKVYSRARLRSCTIVNTLQELIKVRGFQVAPPELEAVLLSHPEIVDAAVIGVQFGRDESELPRAYIVRRPGLNGAKLTEKEVKEYSQKRLAKFKSLEGGIKFLDAIPKNASGKILKRILREQAKKEIGATTRL